MPADYHCRGRERYLVSIANTSWTNLIPAILFTNLLALFYRIQNMKRKFCHRITSRYHCSALNFF